MSSALQLSIDPKVSKILSPQVAEDLMTEAMHSHGFWQPSVGTAKWANPFVAADALPYQPGAIWLGRNPLNSSQALGYKDDRHVLLCAGTRTGKGRSIIINNLALWPGSICAVDPKGENATVLANRRSVGSNYCDGLGQETYVLDPFHCAQVDDIHRAFFDPLEALDSNSLDLPRMAGRLAEAMTIIPDGESGQWAKRGKDMIRTIIMHVMTDDAFTEHDNAGRPLRSITTVRRLIAAGDTWAYNALVEMGTDKPFPPMELLWDAIAHNPAFDGIIADQGASLFNSLKEHREYFESVRSAASENTAWIDDPQMRETLTGGSTVRKKLHVKDLKTNPQGHSIFLCLPVDDMSTYGRWQRVMTAAVISQMQRSQGVPANGHPMLMCLDEFPALGKMERLEKAAAEIAGAGVKLLSVVQNLPQLQKLYKEGWETFLGNAGLQIFFGMDDNTTREYLQKALGEMEIVRDVRSQNISATEQFTEGESKGHTHGSSKGRSDGGNESWQTTQGNSTSEQRSKGGNTSQQRTRGGNTSQGQSYGTNSNWSHGQSGGQSNGSNFNTGMLFGRNYTSLSEGYNSGWNSNQGGGKSHSQNSSSGKNWSDSQGTGKNWSKSQGTGRNWSDSRGGGKNWSETTGTSESEQYSQQSSRAQGTQRGEGVTETIQKRPLLPTNEADQFFAAITDPDATYYPGLALVKISGRDPIHVRKVNYDQDPAFFRCFEPHPAHPYVPIETKQIEVIEEPDPLPDPIYPRTPPPELRTKTLSERSNIREDDAYRKYGVQGEAAGEDPDAGIDLDISHTISIDLDRETIWNYLVQTQHIGHWSAWIHKADGVELKDKFEIGDVVSENNTHQVVWCVPGRKICFKGVNSHFVEVSLKSSDYHNTTIQFRAFMFKKKAKKAIGSVGLSIGKGIGLMFKNNVELTENSMRAEQDSYLEITSRDFNVYINRMRYLGIPETEEPGGIFLDQWYYEPGILHFQKAENSEPIFRKGNIYPGCQKIGYYEPTTREVKEFDQLINECYLQTPRSPNTRSVVLEIIKNDGDLIEYGDIFAIYREYKELSSSEMMEIGHRYLDGDGISVDYLQAAAWFNLAVEYGENYGLIELSHLYMGGLGVSKKANLAEALRERFRNS